MSMPVPSADERVVGLVVNGEERRGLAEPRLLLVDFIRQLRRWYWRSRRRVDPPPAP